MRLTLVAAIAAACELAASGPLHAQLSGAGTSVTLTLPVNLTGLSPDLERVKMQCGILSQALVPPSNLGLMPGPAIQSMLMPTDEALVISGQLVTTLKVFIFIPIEFLQDPIGKSAEYQCGLAGFSKKLQRWEAFSETSAEPAFLLKGLPAEIKGTFVW